MVSLGVFPSKKNLGTQGVGFLGTFLAAENSNPPIEGVGQVVDMLGMASVGMASVVQLGVGNVGNSRY